MLGDEGADHGPLVHVERGAQLALVPALVHREGALAVLAGGEPVKVAQALAFLREQGVVVEEMSYVE